MEVGERAGHGGEGIEAEVTKVGYGMAEGRKDGRTKGRRGTDERTEGRKKTG
jgi:hypothetical protein